VREFIHEYTTRVRGEDGTMYAARTYAAERSDGTWIAWLEFTPAGALHPTLHTGQETSQPTRAAVEYWAGGLEPVYLEGALARAQAGASPGGDGRRASRWPAARSSESPEPRTAP
jgi:hypothetical protein